MLWYVLLILRKVTLSHERRHSIKCIVIIICIIIIIIIVVVIIQEKVEPYYLTNHSYASE